MRPLIVAAKICGVATTATAQPQPGVVYGVVTNINGVKLARVVITVEHSDISVMTNDSGAFRIDDAPLGRVLLNARRVGFKSQQKGFKVDAGRAHEINFKLEGVAAADELDTVLVVAKGGSSRMAGFWNRRDIGNGAFITRADIERRNPYAPSDLLRMVSGVRVLENDDPSGRPLIQMGRTGEGMSRGAKNVTSLAASCNVSYYIDGNYVPPGTFHMDDLSPNAMEAIEVYRGPAETPPQFRQVDTACGLIVIWTREPPPKQRKDTTSGKSPVN